jgi:Big-like domain-containing protein
MPSSPSQRHGGGNVTIRHSVMRHLCAATTAAAIVLAGCKGTEPFVPVATTVHVNPAALTFTSLGATQTLVAVVLDQRRDTMKGATVTWASDNGSVASVSATGVVTAVANGSAHVTATSDKASAPVGVSVVQAAARLIKSGGDAQTAVVRTTLPAPLSLKIVDAGGSPMAGLTVTFAVTLGGGSLSNPSGATDAAGVTTIQWTLGPTAGAPQEVQASLAGVSPVTFTATAIGGTPASVVKLSGDGQTAATNNPVAVPPAVQVRDLNGAAVPAVAVTFAVATGGGSVSGSVAHTDANGVATVGSWTLGPGAGENTLTATVAGSGISGNPVTFTATAAQPGAPASVSVSAGDGQTGLAGFPLNVAPAVVVRDGANFPVPNVAVTFTVASGGGAVTGGNATSGLNGVASVGSWTVQLGANTLTATVSAGGVSGSPLTMSATGVAAAYQIDVRYLTAVTAAQREAFDSAKAKWQRVIYGDVSDEAASFAAGTCGAGTPAINETIDDIIIFVRLDSIDGPGKILGQAGPCIIRTPGYLPAVGVMRFDTADVASLLASGDFDEVIRHEMGHVLSYGTIWSPLGLLAGPAGSGGTDPHFVGLRAIAAFDGAGGRSYSAGAKVPVENCIGYAPGRCGAGTLDSHWRETVLGNELMTGFLNAGVPNPLSVISAASMEDLGYVVNYAGSDPYTVPTPAALRAPLSAPSIELGDDILRLPILVVDASGRVMRVVQPR